MTPFYKKALQLFAKTQTAQIKKGLAKYPEPFNPHSWTPEELLNHALEETVDLTHYLVGLKDLLDAKDKKIKELEDHINELLANPGFINEPFYKPDDKDKEIEFLVKKIEALEGMKDKPEYDLNYQPVPKYFDPDDQ